MDLIKKTICLRDYECRINPYLVNGVLLDPTIYTGITSNWGNLTGYTSDGNIEYYTGSTSGITANLLSLNILFTQTFDDIGILTDVINTWVANKKYYKGETVIYNDYSYKCIVTSSNSSIFNLSEWEDNFLNIPTGNTVTFIGESKIDEFRRYSKKIDDKDLYNPKWNSGFTQEIKDVYGNINKIIGERANYSGIKQNLYDYVLGANEDDLINTGIHYSDVTNGISSINYSTSGLTKENSILSPNIKQEYLLGAVESPKIISDVLIDRGVNSTFDRNLKLGDVRTLYDLTNYGNGFFKINEN